MANELLTGILAEHKQQILEDWLKRQLIATSRRADLIDPAALRSQSAAFVDALEDALRKGAGPDTQRPEWDTLHAAVSSMARQRAQMGFTTTETAMFVLSLKQPLFDRLREAVADNPQRLADETWQLTVLLDAIGLNVTEAFQKGREGVILRQQQELLELSTPVVLLWDGILALPLIGTLDSARTQVVMESLLQEIVAQRATIAIIDITGVATVDTLVAQHLLKTVAAARLMGADCIISGIRPQIAQTIVHLGVDLGDVGTKATLNAAFATALKRNGLAVLPEAMAEARKVRTSGHEG